MSETNNISVIEINPSETTRESFNVLMQVVESNSGKYTTYRANQSGDDLLMIVCYSGNEEMHKTLTQWAHYNNGSIYDKIEYNYDSSDIMQDMSNGDYDDYLLELEE